jgi:hypothetical protein
MSLRTAAPDRRRLTGRPGDRHRDSRVDLVARGMLGDDGCAARVVRQMSPIISRGFRGRRQGAPPGRVPPGQYVTRDFPVLSAGPTPHTPVERWDFTISGEVDEPRRWTWDEFRALPSEEVTVDIHCVTKWSKLDTVWQGVRVDTLLEGVETSAGYTVAFSDGGYTTNVPLEETSPGGRRGSRSAMTASRCRRCTAARRGCWYPTCTSGRARSGCGDCG